LIKLKQQEIDLRAAETMMKQKQEQERLDKDVVIDSARVDLDRDKLEINAGLELMKTSTDSLNKEKERTLKRNMELIREEAKKNDR